MAVGSERHRHLDLEATVPGAGRRKGRGFARKAPDDPAKHAERLLRQTEALEARVDDTLGGFDPRRVFKLNVTGIPAEDLETIDGFEVVAQEGDSMHVLFATDAAQLEFRRRLHQILRGEKATRQDVIFAMGDLSGLTADDRTGPVLRAAGIPSYPGQVDVELWPLSKGNERPEMVKSFKLWLDGVGGRLLDFFEHTSLVLGRVELPDAGAAEKLLRHRDVRRVELPPQYTLEVEIEDLSLMELAPIPSPSADAPMIAILDTGITANHPLLGPAVAHAEGFTDAGGASDPEGHGTAVAGLALYGDVEAAAASRAFVPVLRLIIGRVVDGRKASSKLLEGAVDKAVRELRGTYGVRVFNLSIGGHPYAGGRVGNLAVTIDSLSRSLDVLFVVSAGNYQPTFSPRWVDDYPRYLLEKEAAILDPAPALNALTVGSLARYEAPEVSTDPAIRPIACRGQPSPMTTAGPGALGALKPEVVAYGGNDAVELRRGSTLQTPSKLGELSLAHDHLTGGRLFARRSGTSFAAPKIAHLAGRLLLEYPDASPSLLRALIVGSARVPEASTLLGLSDEDLRRLVGYGQPSEDAAIFSSENRVTLVAQAQLAPDQTQFYEIPVAEDFTATHATERRLVVALAHAPIVRTTRAAYRAARFEFRLTKAPGVEELAKRVRALQAKEKTDPSSKAPKEARPADVNATERERGTVQRAVYKYSRVMPEDTAQRLFLVVTCIAERWARDIEEPEPYAVAVTIEAQSKVNLRLYSQLRVRLRPRARIKG